MKKATLGTNGRFVIPKSFRRELNMQDGASLVVTLEDNSVVIRQEQIVCKCCGTFVENNQEFPLCNDCIEEIKKNYILN